MSGVPLQITAAAAPALTGEQRLEALEIGFQQLRNDTAQVVTEWQAQEAKLLAAATMTFEQHKAAIVAIVNEVTAEKVKMDDFYEKTRQEFEVTQGKINMLFEMTNKKVTEIEAKLHERDRDGGGGSGPSGHKDYIPTKNMIPKTYADKLEDWRSWHEEVEDTWIR